MTFICKILSFVLLYNKSLKLLHLVVGQELTKREVEYVALSRDTTETDLKQRREIRSGTAFYIDQVNLLGARRLSLSNKQGLK